MAASKTPKNKQLADLAKMLKKSNDAAALSASQGVVMPSLVPGAAAAPVMDTTEGSTMMGADNGLQYQGQMMGLNDREKALNLQMAGMNPGVAPEVKTDPRRAYIAAGLGLLGALFNKGNNGTRQAGFGAMQNVLSAAERERQDKANRAAQAQALDFQTKLRTYQAQLGNIGIDKNALIAGENQKSAQAKSAYDQEWKQKEYDLKVKTLDETTRRNMANEEIAKYRASPEFVKEREAMLKAGYAPAMVDAMILAPFEERIAKVFNLKARTDQTVANTDFIKTKNSSYPTEVANKQKYLEAVLGQKAYQFDRELTWNQDKFGQERIDKANAAAAKAVESDKEWPKYGGMTQDQQKSASKSRVEQLFAQITKITGGKDDIFTKAAVQVNPELKKLVQELSYWQEVYRKISTGQRLSRDPWAPPGLADQKQMKGGYAPLLPPTIGLRPSSAPAGPIGKK